MQYYAPDYYTAFSCLGSACRHTCCRGWEIDIDAETYARYQKEEGAFGARLRAAIMKDESGAHFRLGEDERCPFLSRDNLCDIIIELGEEALCAICTDHPRYRNFFENRTEIGLGLACEAACGLILSGKTKPEMRSLGGEGNGTCTPEEQLFFALRAEILEVIFAADTAEEAMETLAARFSLCEPELDWAAFYGGLEILHASWADKVKTLSEKREQAPISDLPKKQLMAYFVYRHLADGREDGRYVPRISFALHATKIISRLSSSDAEFLDTARRYSEEVEYAAENMERVLSVLE